MYLQLGESVSGLAGERLCSKNTYLLLCEGGKRRLVVGGFCSKNKALLGLCHGFDCLLCCLFRIKPWFLTGVPPYNLIILELLCSAGICRCSTVSCLAIHATLRQLNNTLASRRTTSTAQL